MITLLLHLLRLSRGAAALATAAVLPAVCGTAPPPATAAGGRVTAPVGGRRVPPPEAAGIPDGVVLLQDATTTALGARRAVRGPPGARIIDRPGATVTAGFLDSRGQLTGA